MTDKNPLVTMVVMDINQAIAQLRSFTDDELCELIARVNIFISHVDIEKSRRTQFEARVQSFHLNN
jgi:iron uptake system EfeUOB component EfeO/EfeM